MVPRNEHSAPESIHAKQKELKHFLDYDVYVVIDKPRDANVLGTQWVIVDKEVPGEKSLVRKARLCMRGDQEENVKKIKRILPP